MVVHIADSSTAVCAPGYWPIPCHEDTYSLRLHRPSSSRETRPTIWATNCQRSFTSWGPSQSLLTTKSDLTLWDAIKVFFPHCFMMKSMLMKQKVANRSPLRDFMVQNDYFSADFYKYCEVTCKHSYRRHIFLVWLKVLNWSSSFCARPCLFGVHVNAWCGVCGCPSVVVIGNWVFWVYM